MIFVTIGTQEPFDRLLKCMELIVDKYRLDVVVQNSPLSLFNSTKMKMYSFLEPSDFQDLFSSADLVIAHAGMGTIISSLVEGKKLIVFPRKKSLGEHRSDHQQATAKYFGELGYIKVAWSTEDLESLISDYLNGQLFGVKKTIGDCASNSLIESLKQDLYF